MQPVVLLRELVPNVAVVHLVLDVVDNHFVQDVDDDLVQDVVELCHFVGVSRSQYVCLLSCSSSFGLSLVVAAMCCVWFPVCAFCLCSSDAYGSAADVQCPV